MLPFRQFCEAINRPDDIAGWGFDDDYMNNPYHNILRAHKFEYVASIESGGQICHRYVRGNQQAEVCGNTWKVLAGSRMSGGHPNTQRAGADLERALVGAGI
jgi:hypothetical protein